MRKTLAATLLFLFAAFPALALDLGDKAPAITPDKWVSGSEIDPTKPEEGTFFIVEVWSTTCPPCVRSIPMLNDIQKRYADKGLRIVSFTTDTLDEVEPFLKQHPMEYPSFIDKEGATYINYMAADNRNTIPHAFLFDKAGLLVWIGNPLDNIEGKVKQVLDGTLTGEHALAIREAREGLQTAFEGQNVDGMLASLKTLQKLEPDNVQYYQLNLRILSQFGGKPEDVAALYSAWYEGCKDNAEALMVLALVAVEEGHPEQRNPALALAAAKRAYSLDSDAKLEAGLALSETYKNLGRLDLAITTVDSMKALTKDPGELAVLDSLDGFYRKAKQVGENPDVEFKP